MMIYGYKRWFATSTKKYQTWNFSLLRLCDTSGQLTWRCAKESWTYHLAKTRHKACKLNQGAYSFQDTHVCESNFLERGKISGADDFATTYLDVLQLHVFGNSDRKHKILSRIFQERIRNTHSSKVFTTRKMVTTMSTALYPWSHSSLSFSIAGSMSPFRQCRIIVWTMMGCGWSQTLKTLSPETNPNPECVDCRLLIACRMSPSEVNIRAVRPSSLYSTCMRTWEKNLWGMEG